MSKLPRVLGAAMFCLLLFLSGSISMAMQDQAMPAKDPAKKAEKDPAKKAENTKTSTLSGTVSAVTDSTLTIIDSEKAEHTLTLTSDTKVTKGGKDATLADVKANDTVTVEAKKGEGNTWTAMKISLS